MFDAPQIRTEGMPEGMRILLETYPRETWEAHPGFRDKTRHWLGAHQMFRRLAELIRGRTEHFLDRDVDAQEFAALLSRYGSALVGNLHGHHGWEDLEYFPELSAADPRFDRGLEILEQDHKDLDGILDSFAQTANRVIKLVHLDEAQAYDHTGELLEQSQAIETLLQRHLGDEEDLAVPIILHHRLRE